MGNGWFYGLAGVSNTAADVTFVLLFLLFSVAAVLITVFLLTKFIYRPKAVSAKSGNSEASAAEPQNRTGINFTGLLITVLAIGLIVRLVFTFIIRGYREDMRIFTGLAETMSLRGLSFYYADNGILFYPLTALIYSVFGGLANAFSVGADSVAMPVFFKLPLILCDLATACVLYRIAKKYINEYAALTLAGFFALFPVFIFASSVWGSVYSIFMLLTVLCFYFAANKNYPALIGVYSLSLLTVKDALYLFPVVGVFIIVNYIRYCKRLKNDSVSGFKDLMRDKDLRNVVLIPVYIIASVILMYLLSLPVMSKMTTNFFKWLHLLFLKPLVDLTVFGVNPLNIFNLFGRNGIELTAGFPGVIFAILFGLIITALVLLIYLSRRNRANLSFLGAYIMLTLSIFYMGFGALNLIPVLGLLLLAFILIKDKRILQVFGILSFAVLFNASAVMAQAGYLNNLREYDLSSANSLYTGSVLLDSGGGMAISIICSCITIAAFVYATIVLLDFSMSNKRKLFKTIEKPGFFSSVKNWIK